MKRGAARVSSGWLERALISCGIALLLFAGGAKLTGEVQRQRDLSRFAAALVAAGTPAQAGEEGLRGQPQHLDTSLWSPQRVRAYQESLRHELGAPLAILSIPKIGLEVPVLEGTDDLTLNRAVGLIARTASPGESGNVGIAGHRDGYFRGLRELVLGDTIELRTLAARQSYIVDSIRIVAPEEVSVLAQTSSSIVTLVTCYPFYFVGHAPLRYIVRAVQRDFAPMRPPWSHRRRHPRGPVES